MKNLLSENMMRFGTKNLTEAAKKDLVVKSIIETINQHGLSDVIHKALSEQATAAPVVDPNLGLAQKIVGTIWKAMSGIGTEPMQVYNAVFMIKNPAIYKSVINILRTSPKIKQEYGRNFSLVSNWIGTDLKKDGGNSFGEFFNPRNNKIIDGMNSHLSQFNDSELFGGTSGMASGI